MSQKKFYLLALAAVCALAPAFFAQSPNFVADVVFKGSALTGWHPLGSADWHAENGEIIGTPKDESGGWLLLDKGYQDIAFYSSFRCSGTCKAGVLLRAEKTTDGIKGVFVSLGDGDVGSYEVLLDAQGKELSRTRLATGAAQMVRNSMARTSADEAVPGFSKPAASRTDPPPPPPAARPAAPAGGAGTPGAAAGGRGGRGGRGAPGLRANDWNTVQVILDSDLLSLAVNGGRGGAGGATSDRMMGFGPLALYAGGSGEVRFKDVSYKDINPKFEPKETVSSNFQVQRINDFYYAWCAAAADINRDGVLECNRGTVLLSRTGVHREARVYLIPNLQPEQPVFAGHGQLCPRFYRRRLARHIDGGPASNLSVREPQRRIAALGSL
jgi:hypothetical protein